MAIVVTASTGVVQTDTTQSTQVFRGTLTFSGSYVEGGDTVSLANAFGIQSLSLPLEVEIIQKIPTGQAPVYTLTYLYGSTTANGAIYIFDDVSSEELAAGAYASPFTDGVFEIKAYFPCFV